MSDIMIGLKGVQEMTVQRHHVASVWGNIGASVLSTHYVVLLMEKAARKAIESCLPEKTITIGTMISIKHVAAAPIGARVRAEARLERIEGRRLVFKVVAYDEHEKISEGENEQIIVSVKRFLEKIRKKELRVSADGAWSDMMFWL